MGHKIVKYIPLMGELVKRDLRLKYRRSILGYLWSLLNPLMMMTLMSFIFSYMFRFDIDNYPIYLISGQMLFNFFSEATNMSMFSVIQNAALMKKVYVPKIVFPISRVLSSFVTMAFSLLAIVIVMFAVKVEFHLTVFLFWIPLLFLIFFATGVGIMLSALAVKFRDVTHLYSVLIMAWMYMTPIFYPVEAVPAEVYFVIKHNPLYNIVTLFRDLVMYGRISQIDIWIGAVVPAVLSLIIGSVVFSKMEKNFIYYI